MIELEKERFQKEVLCPFSGQKFTIRRVRFKEFMIQIGGLPLPVATNVQEVMDKLREKTQAGDIETENKIVRFYISRGVVEPKIWFGDEKECPAEQLYYEDLGGDLDYVAGEIIGYSHEMAGLKDMENFFRGTGARAPGPNGQTIRTETLDPDPAGNS